MLAEGQLSIAKLKDKKKGEKNLSMGIMFAHFGGKDFTKLVQPNH